MADADKNSDSLGPWADADLGKTAHADAGIGADDGLPSDVRFVTNVAKLLRRRRAQPGAEKDLEEPAIFLLQPIPPGPESAPKTTKRIPMLDNGLTIVNGRIWFIGAGPGSGHYLEYEATNDDNLFRLVTDTLGQAATPAILYDPRLEVPEARFYPLGLGEPDKYRIVPIGTVEISFEEVVNAVEGVYKSCLVTPRAQSKVGKLWNHQAKRWPSKNAEAIVQLHVKAGLAGAFPTCTVREEQPMAEGNLDLEIEQSDPLDRGKVTRHAVLELKVLRSFRATGGAVTDNETLDWITSGVTQVNAYGQGKGAKLSALLCFDMRKENTGEKCFDHVRELAASLNVCLRRWFLYAKSKHYQESLASTA